MKNLETFTGQTKNWPKKVGEGSYGKVYSISNNFVAKVDYYWPRLIGNPIEFEKYEENSLKLLEHEFNVMEEAYKEGLNVPKPEGIYNVSLRSFRLSDLFSKHLIPGLVMEKIKGKTLDNLQVYSEREPYSQLNSQRKLAREKGFVIADSHNGNAIWDPKQRKTYLIDFAGWIKLNKNE